MRCYLVKNDYGDYLCQGSNGVWCYAPDINHAHRFTTEYVALKFAGLHNGYLVRATATIRED